tara:strand:- start:1637 stop:2869 length:1233 start_codon:yes stop_codon:yes gene_type:complete
MNIIQVEDNLKSVPDNRLQQEMSNPSGMFPQYLVMSEISRRAKMRTDYEGRMAANEKTPPRPSMREEMLMSMQSNVPSGGIADLVNPTQQSSNNAMPPIPQEPVRMAAGTTVPFDPYGMFGFTFREDDPETEEDERGYFREKSEVQKALEEYYKSRAKLMPEKLDKQRKLAGGLNLLQAGIAVGTSATPEQIGANLNNLIDGISKSEMQLTKQEDKLAKEQIDGLVAQAGFEKAERDDLAKATELKLKAEKEKATAEYMRSLGDKSSPIGQVAEEIKAGVFGDPKSLGIYKVIGNDEKGNPIYGDEIDAVELVNLAKELQPTVQRGISSDIADILTEDKIDSMAIVALVAGGMSYQEAQAKVAKEARDKKLELIQQYRASKQINPQRKQTGGIIQNSVRDFNDVLESISG